MEIKEKLELFSALLTAASSFERIAFVLLTEGIEGCEGDAKEVTVIFKELISKYKVSFAELAEAGIDLETYSLEKKKSLEAGGKRIS